MANATQEKIEAYLGQLRVCLRGLQGESVREILEELRSHIMEKAAADGEMTSAAVDAALSALGSPEDLANQYLTDEVLARAEASRSPLRILDGLFRWGSLSLTGFFALIGSVTGYFFGAVFVLSALLKPLHPGTAGLWVIPDGADDFMISLRLGFEGAPLNGREILGWWIVPIGMVLGCGLVVLSTRFAVWCVRQYAVRRDCPGADVSQPTFIGDKMSESIQASRTSGASPVGSAAACSRLTRGQKLFSLAEFALGGAVVVAHNVYHVIPNEVYILVVMGLISLRLRDGGWSLLGMGWPASWRRTIVIAVIAAAIRLLLSGLVIDPLTAHFWPSPPDAYGFNEITGHVTVALRWLLFAWIFAAFGEEISYRGYLLTRAADVGNRSKAAYWIGLLVVSALFGIGHYYKGPGGMIDSGTGGLVFGAAYLLSGRNLWVSILAHGLVDTFGVVALFLGWAT